MKDTRTSPAYVEALEALLDVLLDGRCDDLDEKEQAAVQMAEAALALHYDHQAD